jgi:hypothetical protein
MVQLNDLLSREDSFFDDVLSAIQVHQVPSEHYPVDCHYNSEQQRDVGSGSKRADRLTEPFS